jgi:hypothetical protein
VRLEDLNPLSGDEHVTAQARQNRQPSVDLLFGVDDFDNDRQVVGKPAPNLVNMPRPAVSGDAARNIGTCQTGIACRQKDRLAERLTVVAEMV